MVVAVTLFHAGALVILAAVLRRFVGAEETPIGALKASWLIACAVLGVVGIHTVETWAWALLYLGFGEFDSLIEALYFSAVTSTTLGYGDVTLSPRWQLMGTFEAMAGLILFGASTAFILYVLRRALFNEEND